MQCVVFGYFGFGYSEKQLTCKRVSVFCREKTLTSGHEQCDNASVVGINTDHCICNIRELITYTAKNQEPLSKEHIHFCYKIISEDKLHT
jgi:hypothetical protein